MVADVSPEFFYLLGVGAVKHDTDAGFFCWCHGMKWLWVEVLLADEKTLIRKGRRGWVKRAGQRRSIYAF